MTLEAKKKLRGTENLYGFTIFFSVVDKKKRVTSEVGILVDQTWYTKIVSYIYVNERVIIIVRFKW